MGLLFHDLDDLTRQNMAAEIERDIGSGELYLGKYLSDAGRREYPALLQTAARDFDIDWLANEIARPGLLEQYYPKRTPSGGTTLARVGYDANRMLAEGEFNR